MNTQLSHHTKTSKTCNFCAIPVLVHGEGCDRTNHPTRSYSVCKQNQHLSANCDHRKGLAAVRAAATAVHATYIPGILNRNVLVFVFSVENPIKWWGEGGTIMTKNSPLKTARSTHGDRRKGQRGSCQVVTHGAGRRIENKLSERTQVEGQMKSQRGQGGPN